MADRRAWDGRGTVETYEGRRLERISIGSGPVMEARGELEVRATLIGAGVSSIGEGMEFEVVGRDPEFACGGTGPEKNISSRLPEVWSGAMEKDSDCL